MDATESLSPGRCAPRWPDSAATGVSPEITFRGAAPDERLLRTIRERDVRLRQFLPPTPSPTRVWVEYHDGRWTVRVQVGGATSALRASCTDVRPPAAVHDAFEQILPPVRPLPRAPDSTRAA